MLILIFNLKHRLLTSQKFYNFAIERHYMKTATKIATDKKLIRKLFISILISPLLFSGLTPANASQSGYRYWGYFQAPPASNSWVMAMTGPTTNVPDGSVEGWIHTFGNEVINAVAPNPLPNFAELCKKVRPVADKKRIGLIVDFGTSAIKPKGESIPRRVRTCILIDRNANGAEILAAATKIRASASGFICGINGYPAKECSAEIKTPRTLLKNLKK